MYRVEYFCPRQAPYWQGSQGRPYDNLDVAIAWCEMVKPREGMARVVDVYGRVVYQI